MLSAVNELSQALRDGLNERTAEAIAQAACRLLGAESVGVTNSDRMLAAAGRDLDWQRSVEDQASIVRDRRRTRRPTIYSASVGTDTIEVAVSVIANEGLPVGTIHAAMTGDVGIDLDELQQFTDLVSTQLQLAELEQSRLYAAEAELQALRAQISPHFLHNALTAIAGLVNTDPARARSLIATLAEFMRSTFRSSSPITTFKEELRLVEAYLELERARFGDRFDIRLNIAPEALPVKMPFLTIQPLVENAIRHGLESRPGPGQLTIKAVNAGPEIAVHVEDDGVGIDPDLLEAALSGTDETVHIGLVSVDTRLRSYFGAEYGLTIETGSDAGTKATVRIPKTSPY